MLIYSIPMSTTRSPHTRQAHAPPGRTHESPLQIHHAECEANFLRLQKLLPGFEGGHSRCIGLRALGSHEDALDLRVLERSAYTAELTVRQQRPVWGHRPSEFRVRVYLDARMAEVTGCASVFRLLPRYPYPNTRGLARDERWQLNRLLGEWLARCLADGYAPARIALASGA